MRRLRIWAAILALTAFGQTAVADGFSEDICTRGSDGVFFGRAFTLSYEFPVSRPLEEGATPAHDGLFPSAPAMRSAGAGEAVKCNGGGMVNAINCVAERIEGASAAATGAAAEAMQAAADAARAAAASASARGPSAGADTGREAGADEDSAVTITMEFRPVFDAGTPAMMSIEAAGPTDIASDRELSDEDARQMAGRVAEQMRILREWQVPLDATQTEAVIDGAPLGVGVPFTAEGVQAATDKTPAYRMPAACASLFRAYVDRDALRQRRADVAERAQRLRDEIERQREEAGALGYFWDSEWVDRAEALVERLDQQLSAIDGEIAEKTDYIDRRGERLSEEDRERELEAIRSDPERLAAEEQRRRDALIEAARDARKYKWQLIEGEQEYAKKLAAYDALINRAETQGNDAYADQLRSDKSRLETARDQWREHTDSVYQSRLSEQQRLLDRNRSEGIGPVQDATSLLLSEGENPVEVLEGGAREAARAFVSGRVATDARTLGGSATEEYTLDDFARDLGDSNAEMWENPELFAQRYGSYLQGAGEATKDAVSDLAMLAAEAGDTAGEAFESGLSDVTGHEFNSFGRENLDTIVGAAETLSEADALAIGEAAGDLADYAGRRVEQLAGQGEAGIREALRGTGYATASILGAEEVALAGALKASRLGRAAGDAATAGKAADAATDAARAADAAGDARRAGNAAGAATDAARGAGRMDAPARNAAHEADAARDVARRTDGSAGEMTATAAPSNPARTRIVEAPTAQPEGSLAADGPVGLDDGSVKRAEGAVRDTPVEARPVAPEKETRGMADVLTDRRAPDATATTRIEPGPDAPASTRVEPGPDAAATTRVEPGPDATASTRVEPGPDATATTRIEPGPDATASTRIEPGPDATATTRIEPGPDATATTRVEPGPEFDTTMRDPTLDAPVGRAAVAHDPDATMDLDADAIAARIDDLPAAERAPDATGGVRPEGEAKPGADFTFYDSPARAPPKAERIRQPLEAELLDSALDTSPDYRFSGSLASLDNIPDTGRVSGPPFEILTKGPNPKPRVMPGRLLRKPDGSNVVLGDLIGTGATANIFENALDQNKVIRLVKYSGDSKNMAKLDLVGRRVAEAVQDADGNGLFRTTRIEDQFIMSDPNGERWMVAIDENLAQTGGGITDAKTRFAQRRPNAAEELTMALAIRQMNRRGVVWTDHKLANFDIVPNPESPTGYQMVIFDTGGVRPVAGSDRFARGRNAQRLQRVFDQTPAASKRGRMPIKFIQDHEDALKFFDDRVFDPPDPVEPVRTGLTPNQINRPDHYLDLSSMHHDDLEDLATETFGREISIPFK
ncbi:hypothetical protein [Sediminimonas qiaohouensis]|uniref:hypothetical protein n=1 Tax=Sediminimonas qiaohouensis TaxID=552061 RepID=UPI00040CAE99|nr:hypothetical protein [Sediminimonas qiaohouensis]